jgi:hypothetical protein
MRSSIAILAISATLATQTIAQTSVPGMQVKNPAAEAAQKILTKPLQVENYSWTYGSPTQLPPVATHICMLSGFTGKLAGGGELGKLFIDTAAPGGPRYMLSGTTGQGQFKVMAHCALRAQFVWSGTSTPQPKISPLVQASGCAPQSKFIKEVSGASFLAAFGGRFAGEGEMIAVNPSLFGAVAKIHACSGVLTAGAIGYEASTPLVYRNLSARTSKAGESTFYFGRGSNNKDTIAFLMLSEIKSIYKGVPEVVPYDEAFCGLTAINGKFNGYGEKLEIQASPYPDKQKYWWILASYSSDANLPYVGGAVRCLSRDQRPVS